MSLTLNLVYFTGFIGIIGGLILHVCQYVFQNHVKSRKIYVWGLCQGRPQDLRGGGQEFFFFRFGNLHVAKRHAAHC